MVILQGQRSIIWVKIAHFGHFFCNIQHSNSIFGMHVYLIELHILSGVRSMSRPSFKVKGQIYESDRSIGDIVFHKHILFTFNDYRI